MESSGVDAERKLVTVLFADVVGSTAFGSMQDAERTRSTLERFFSAMSAEIAAAGGTVEKFIGDAVVAVFGAPVAVEDHAHRALVAALEMQARMADLFAGALELRIGVNTGEVVVGGASEGSFATGDTMNVAARLEQAASPRQVLAGERTAAAVAQAFVFGDAMVVEAKGKPGGVACRPVLGVAPSVVSRVVATPHVFVGRQSDLEALRAAYNQVCSHASVQLVADYR